MSISVGGSLVFYLGMSEIQITNYSFIVATACYTEYVDGVTSS
jgi:hypothetical protein